MPVLRNACEMLREHSKLGAYAQTETSRTGLSTVREAVYPNSCVACILRSVVPG